MDNVLDKIIDFGKRDKNIVGIVLTSSRVNPNSEIDFLSDYDIEVFVQDLSPFLSDDWMSYFGVPMAKWPDLAKTNDKWITRLVLFENKVRIDFQISSGIPVKKSYLNGYKVLVDKDGIFGQLDQVTYKQYALKKPSESDYLSLTREFFWDLYYVYKYLYRENLGFSKYMIDTVIRNEYLHVLLDYYLASKQGFNVEVQRFGLDYQKYLNIDEYNWYLDTYSSLTFSSILKSADSLLKLFESIAIKLGNKLGYKYPTKTHQLVMSFCDEIMDKYNKENGVKELPELSLEELWEIFPIKVEQHNPEYTSWYEDESKRLRKLLGNKIFRINHIGSTAIPNLIAKPTVDILCEVYEGVSFEDVTQKLASVEYILSSKQQEPFYRYVFNKGYSKYGYEDRVFHLHLRYPSDWSELYFRDYLLKYEDVSREYGQLKAKLATEYKHHRDHYTNAKGDFISIHTNKAREEFNKKYKVDKENKDD